MSCTVDPWWYQYIWLIDSCCIHEWWFLFYVLLFSDMICGDAKLRVVCLYQWKAWCLCSHHDVAILLSMRWTRLTPTRTKATRTMKSMRAQFENGDIILRTRRPAFNKTTYWISKPPPTATFAEIFKMFESSNAQKRTVPLVRHSCMNSDISPHLNSKLFCHGPGWKTLNIGSQRFFFCHR